MAQTLQLGDIIQVDVACFSNGQLGLNRSHWKVTTFSGTGATDQDCANILDANFSTAYRNLLGNNASYYGVKVTRIVPLPPTAPVTSTANQGLGVVLSPSLPQQVSGVITMGTAFAGRAFRGRVYVPFPPTSMNDAVLDVPIAAYKPLLDALGALYRGDFLVGTAPNQITIDSVLVHRANKAGVTPPPTTILTSRSNLKWGTQRRRGNYGRPNVFPPF
jgi:hypothetical protein